MSNKKWNKKESETKSNVTKTYVYNTVSYITLLFKFKGIVHQYVCNNQFWKSVTSVN